MARKLVTVLVVVAIVGLLVPAEAQNTQIWEFNVFEAMTKMPWEMCMVIFSDGFGTMVTQEQESSVGFPVQYVEEHRGRLVSDIVFFVHSHINIGGFSEQDVRTFHKLYDRGFRGHYILVMFGGRVIEYKYKVKK